MKGETVPTQGCTEARELSKTQLLQRSNSAVQPRRWRGGAHLEAEAQLKDS